MAFSLKIIFKIRLLPIVQKWNSNSPGDLKITSFLSTLHKQCMKTTNPCLKSHWTLPYWTISNWKRDADLYLYHTILNHKLIILDSSRGVETYIKHSKGSGAFSLKQAYLQDINECVAPKSKSTKHNVRTREGNLSPHQGTHQHHPSWE